MLLEPSEEAKDGRYFHKTLAELDEMTLVRDRTGSGAKRPRDEMEEEAEEQEENVDEEVVEEEDESGEVREHNKTPAKQTASRTEKQKDLEAEWGLDRTPPDSPRKAAKRVEDQEDSGAETEEEEEAEYRVRLNLSLASRRPRRRKMRADGSLPRLRIVTLVSPRMGMAGTGFSRSMMPRIRMQVLTAGWADQQPNAMGEEEEANEYDEDKVRSLRARSVKPLMKDILSLGFLS